MQLAEVVGFATSTIKHSSMTGWRLLVVQPLMTDKKPDGEPVLAIDPLNAGAGQIVIVTNDGAAARAVVKSSTSPVRWLVLGVRDE